MQPIRDLNGYFADSSGIIYYGEELFEIEPIIGEEGYYWIYINDKWYRRCDLIASTLLLYPEIEAPENGWVLDHIDSDKENDALENLEWVEYSNLDDEKTWEFIQKAWDRRGKGTYGYRNVRYIRAKNKMNITCWIHGDFIQNANNHFNGKGCPKCSGKYSPTTEEYIAECIKVHGNKYDYSRTIYKTTNHKIVIICKIHGVFEQMAKSHILGYGCQQCAYITTADKLKKPLDKFIKDAKIVHGDKYDYAKVIYKNARSKIIIICKLHGEFKQVPESHLQNCGCPKCAFMGYSQSAISWLTLIEMYKNIIIQHAETQLGEKQIGKYFADGYIELPEKRIQIGNSNFYFFYPIKKIVFEFQGCFWHGCPDCFPDRNKFNYATSKTPRELYKRTQIKNKYILEQGYKLIEIWECEYNKIKIRCPEENIEEYMATVNI